MTAATSIAAWWWDDLTPEKQTAISESYSLAWARPAWEAANGDRQFGMWLHMVDLFAIKQLGVSVFDLPDKPFADFCEDGMTPAQAWQAIREDGLT